MKNCASRTGRRGRRPLPIRESEAGGETPPLRRRGRTAGRTLGYAFANPSLRSLRGRRPLPRDLRISLIKKPLKNACFLAIEICINVYCMHKFCINNLFSRGFCGCICTRGRAFGEGDCARCIIYNKINGLISIKWGKLKIFQKHIDKCRKKHYNIHVN